MYDPPPSGSGAEAGMGRPEEAFPLSSPRNSFRLLLLHGANAVEVAVGSDEQLPIGWDDRGAGGFFEGVLVEKLEFWRGTEDHRLA